MKTADLFRLEQRHPEWTDTELHTNAAALDRYWDAKTREAQREAYKALIDLGVCDGHEFGGRPGEARDVLARIEALEAVNRGRAIAAAVLNPNATRPPMDWYLSQLGDA